VDPSGRLTEAVGRGWYHPRDVAKINTSGGLSAQMIHQKPGMALRYWRYTAEPSPREPAVLTSAHAESSRAPGRPNGRRTVAPSRGTCDPTSKIVASAPLRGTATTIAYPHHMQAAPRTIGGHALQLRRRRFQDEQVLDAGIADRSTETGVDARANSTHLQVHPLTQFYQNTYGSPASSVLAANADSESAPAHDDGW